VQRNERDLHSEGDREPREDQHLIRVRKTACEATEGDQVEGFVAAVGRGREDDERQMATKRNADPAKV
jgi:hypothetical protein